MNVLYKKVAKAIKMNTLENRFNTIEVVDRDELITALSTHFKETDALFSVDEFKQECEEILKD